MKTPSTSRALMTFLKATVTCGVVASAACHPLSCWHPRDFPAATPYEHTSASDDFPKENVRAYEDAWGVPHIFAETKEDAVYALGFYHAKDRLWQTQTQRYGVAGRLTELLGEDFLAQDQQARLFVYRLEEEFEALTDEDKAICQSYADGVNDGAAYAGPSIEMTVLGVEFEPFEPMDALAIARFLGWRLSSGWDEELARVRIAARVDADEPLYDELLAPVLSLGNPVVRNEEHSGLWGYGEGPAAGTPPTPRPLPNMPKRSKSHPAKGKKPTTKSELVKQFTRQLLSGGASNVWAVSGDHTVSGAPVLANDPHLGHSFPGLAYLVHMEGPDFFVAGTSIPGVPTVLLGHSRTLAWGGTVSNADTQDLIRMQLVDGDENSYMLDGAETAFETLTQTYKIGTGDDADVFEEDWKVSVFGPVLPPGYDHLVDEGDTFVIKSSGLEVLRPSGKIFSSLWDLARAQNVSEGTEALQHLTAPPINFALAATDGTIAYRLNGDIPVRASDEPPFWPRDGSKSDAGWSTYLPPEYKPQLTNPARGFIVSANQRIVEAFGPAANIIGVEGDMPFRAARITERLEALTRDGRKASAAEIYDIQQDAVSIFARELSPIFGTYCPQSVDGMDTAVVTAWCDALRGFDGEYDVESRGALVFNRLERDIKRLVLELHLGEEVAGQVEVQRFVNTNLYAAYKAYDAGENPALLDDPDTEAYEGLPYFITEATKTALTELIEELGANPAQWRWGTVHFFAAKGALAAIPVLGGLFTNTAREEAGCARCPRAEQGTRDSKDEVTYGAFTRLHAEMGDPIEVRAVMETGQSGHFGHKNSYNQNFRWSVGNPLELGPSEDDIKTNASGQVLFQPR